MAAKCDVRTNIQVKAKVGDKEPIQEERFPQCGHERATIVQTEIGRVGLCQEHLEAYSALEPKEKYDFFWLRRGLVIVGPVQTLLSAGT